MPSYHYSSVATYLQETIRLDELKDESSRARALLNISHAVLALSDAMRDEFTYIETKLQYLQGKLDRETPQ